jgi:four helix bundle protein
MRWHGNLVAFRRPYDGIMQPRDHRDLVVWQRAIDLAVLTHLVGEEFTLANRIANAAQLRRSAASVAANIAEGAAREHLGELIQFLSFARGSLAELHTHYEIVGRLNLVGEEKLRQANDTIDHIARMLTKAIKTLKRRR